MKKHLVHESLAGRSELDPREIIFVDESGKEYRGQLVNVDDVDASEADVSVYNAQGRLMYGWHAVLGSDGKWHGSTPSAVHAERNEIRREIARLQAELAARGG